MHDLVATHSQNLQEQFTKAVRFGNIRVLQACIDDGADVNKTANNGITTLMEAVARGYSEIVKDLIAAGFDVNETDNARTAFLYAIEGGNSTIVAAIENWRINHVALSPMSIFGQHIDHLITSAIRISSNLSESGEDIDYIKFIVSSMLGRTDLINDFIRAGGDVNKVCHNGGTALMFAAAQGQTEIVKDFISAGADVNRANKGGYTALMFAALKGHSENYDMVKILIESGAMTNKMNAALLKDVPIPIRTILDNFQASHPVIIAIQENRVNIRAITKRNAQEKTEAGYTALMAAFANDNMKLVQKLLLCGADIYAQDAYGRTALSYAQSAIKINSFIRNNKKLNIKRALGSTYSVLRSVVQIAASDKNYRIVRACLLQLAQNNELLAVDEINKIGGSINTLCSDKGNNLLQSVIKNNRKKLFKTLLQSKYIDIEADVDNDQITPLIIAADNNRCSMMVKLIDQGANINAVSDQGVSALMRAAGRGYSKALKILIRSGADINTRSNDNHTALMWARKYHQDHCVVLLEKAADIRLNKARASEESERKVVRP